jgi:CheY-like chemotaxis protein
VRPSAVDPGLGLGLAIVKRLVELLDHDIQLTSSPDRGTCVRLGLARARPGDAMAPEPAVRSDGNLRGLRVLVVDDEATARDAISGLLARWECAVIAADGAAQALTLARAGRPDVVLCDLALQEETDGVALWEAICVLWPVPPHCAFVTGESAPEVLARARATGHPVLTKPTAPAKLRALLEQFCSAATDAHRPGATPASRARPPPPQAAGPGRPPLLR